MRISPVGYYPSFINTDMYVGNTVRSGLKPTGVANQGGLSPVESVPKVFSNAETERVIKTPEEMQHDREVAMAVLKGKTPREAENLNPHLEKIIEEQMQPEESQMNGMPEGDQFKIGKENGDDSVGEKCETCENRKYVDGSDESNVSFQTAQKISPESAASRVLSHEYEHVRNAMREDQKENAELVSVSVSLKTAICPECGKSYVAGGETRTTMRYTVGGEGKATESMDNESVEHEAA